MKRITVSLTAKQHERLTALRRHPLYSIPSTSGLLRELLNAGLDHHEQHLADITTALAEPTHGTPVEWVNPGRLEVLLGDG